MSTRSLIGILLYVVGLIALVYAGWNFNGLFFVQKLMAKQDIPVYSRMVFMPVLAGILILLDGSFIANLKRMSSGVIYVLGNLAWFYGFDQLYPKLSVPLNEIDAYRAVFYLLGAGVLLFIIGAIVNDIPVRSKNQAQPLQR